MYTERYDLDSSRNSEYRLMDYISKFYKNYFTCLDLGCGSCRKLLPVLPRVKRYYVVDHDGKRIYAAKQKCSSFKNIKYIVADNAGLPLDSGSCDLVSCFMTKYALNEVCRALKPGGLFILETLGAEDKEEIRYILGRDENGWRSPLLNETQEEKKARLLHDFTDCFEIQMFKNLHFKTCIRLEYIIELFQMTNEIRGFSQENDFSRLKHLTDADENVTFWENRLIYVGRLLPSQRKTIQE